MNETLENPEEKVRIREKRVLLSNVIKFGVIFLQKFVLLIGHCIIILQIFLIDVHRKAVIDILLYDSPDDDRQSGENKVVECDVIVIINGLTTPPANKGEVKLAYSENHVLVEEIQDHLRNSNVGPFSMDQNEFP